MHRSGTSALTRVINLLGVDLGQNLMQAKPDNVKGFWEEEEVVGLNDKLLSAFGRRWDDVREFPPGWWDEKEFLPYREKIAEILNREFGPSALWGLKDPRLCRLVPLYRTILHEMGCDVKAVLVLRDPMEVAKSLHAREGMPLYYGLLLWIRYVIDAEKDSRDVPRVWVTYEELLSDWQSVARKIQDTLHITWPVAIDTAAPLIDQFLDPGLRHQKAESERSDEASPLEHLACEVYELVRTAEDSSLLQGSLDEISEKLRELFSLFTDTSTSAEGFSGYFKKNVPSVTDSFLQGEALIETRRNLELQIKLEEVRNNLEKELARTNERLKQLRNEMQQIKIQRDEARHWLEYAKSTYSWKLTRPFRACFRLLKGFSRTGLRVDARRVSLALSLLKQHGVFFLLKQIAIRLWQPPVAVKRRMYHNPTLDNLHAIQLPLSEKPTVSIIIPVFNKFEYTFACLQSILNETDGEYEVIVVDDGSSDLTLQIGDYVSGIRLVRNEENLGFIGSCNAGAGAARGEYLLFLNNDTVVTPGWLDSLLQCFDHFSNVGLAGAKLVYPDGRLQEAGGIIWQDGSGWNYGRLKDPDSPEFNYPREVDFCSGACIIIPHQLFLELGGFDERFKPAYYEDVDLAFKVRKAGRKTMYQPFSEVIHFEGISSGTDLSAGTKRYQVINQKKFYEKWQEELQHHFPAGSKPFLASDRTRRRSVFVIDSYTPMPDRDAGSLRMFRLLQLLVEMGCRVTFSAENLSFHPEYSTSLRKVGVETICHPFVRTMDEFLAERGKFFGTVIMSRRDVAKQYLQAVRQYCPGAKVIFDTVDLHFVREAREKGVSAGRGSVDGDSWHHARGALELVLASQSDEVWVVSEAEKVILGEVAPEVKVEVVSLVHEVEPTNKPYTDREGILFVGSFMHPPNTDAMIYYFEQVHNKVREQLGPVRFYVIGANPPKTLKHLAEKYSEVELTGYVEDIRPYFEKVRLSVAPLRYGAGVKGKISSSMSHGVPVVTTTIGAEGMKLVHGVNAMIADDAEGLADAVVELYNDEDLWKKMVREGFDNIQQLFSFDRAEKALRHALNM